MSIDHLKKEISQLTTKEKAELMHFMVDLLTKNTLTPAEKEWTRPADLKIKEMSLTGTKGKRFDDIDGI